jgi:hypothetical protein
VNRRERSASKERCSARRVSVGAEKRIQARSFVYVDAGHGCRQGNRIEREICPGMNGMAGESGHASADPTGPMCACRTRGSLELSASATGLVHMAKERIHMSCRQSWVRTREFLERACCRLDWTRLPRRCSNLLLFRISSFNPKRDMTQRVPYLRAA